MTENMKQMKERHNKEIKELQENCSHKDVSEWLQYYWAIGHSDGEVRVCNHCGKHVEKRGGIEEKRFE